MTKLHQGMDKNSPGATVMRSASNLEPFSPQQAFDLIVENLKTNKVSESIEQGLSETFLQSTIIHWTYIAERKEFYSETYFTKILENTGIIFHVFKTGQVYTISKKCDSPFFNKDVDAKLMSGDHPVLYIPIVTRDGTSQSIVEIIKTQGGKGFDQKEVNSAHILFKKFHLYSNFLFYTGSAYKAAVDLTEGGNFPQIVGKLNQILQLRFRCRKADIWMNNPKKRLLFRFDPDHETPQLVEPCKAGVIGYCLTKCAPVNERNVRQHPDYNPSRDGLLDEPVLAQPIIDGENRCWAIILRGRASPKFFSDSDAADLLAVAPIGIQTLSASMSPPQFEAQLDDFEQRLTALLEVAEILSRVLDIDVLIPTIMSRACQLLKSDRCSLFLVDQAKQELITRFHGGLSNDIRMPMNRGIVGHTATTGHVVNIADAYEDPRFDKSVDIKTGYRTKSILCVPIYNNRGEIAGVTEMINKLAGDDFDSDDVKMLMAFNVFCGISLDNAKLYNASLELTRQLRTFVDLSAALTHTDTIKNVLHQILENVSKIVSANRATL